ncbi:MAG: hypothetical protein ACRC1P_11010 [Cellulosilyticaceae bacterium]
MSWAEVKKINSNLLKSLDTLITERFNNVDVNVGNTYNKANEAVVGINDTKNAVDVLPRKGFRLMASDTVQVNIPISNGTSFYGQDAYLAFHSFTPLADGFVKITFDLAGDSSSVTREAAYFVYSSRNICSTKPEISTWIACNWCGAGNIYYGILNGNFPFIDAVTRTLGSGRQSYQYNLPVFKGEPVTFGLCGNSDDRYNRVYIYDPKLKFDYVTTQI